MLYQKKRKIQKSGKKRFFLGIRNFADRMIFFFSLDHSPDFQVEMAFHALCSCFYDVNVCFDPGNNNRGEDMKRWGNAICCMLAVAGLFMLGGCSGTKTFGSVKFVTTPPGAEVINLKDDTNMGMTPVLVTWEGDEKKPEYVTVEFRKTDYREEITSFWVNKRHATREAAASEPQPVTVELEKR